MIFEYFYEAKGEDFNANFSYYANIQLKHTCVCYISFIVLTMSVINVIYKRNSQIVVIV
jgi:hypothetical protein